MDAPNRDEAEIFNAARRIGAAEDRDAYLRQACGEDLSLRARVEALLRVHDEDPGFLASPVGGGPRASAFAETRGERPGTRIGPYTLLEPIGEGGFGVVFAAEQRQLVRRTVVVKILKPGMDTGQVVARFEAE